MRKITSVLLSAAILLSLFAVPTVFSKTTAEDYILYDFTNNTVTNNVASDIPTAVNITKEGEAPYTGSLAYGVFGKDKDDASYKFTSECNASSLPADTSVGSNIASPYVQFSSGTKTLGDKDIIHISFDMYVEGYMGSFVEIRPYTYDESTKTHVTKRFVSAQPFSFSKNTVDKVFGSGAARAFKDKQWSRFDIVLFRKYETTVDGVKGYYSAADAYIDGIKYKDKLVMDADNQTDGYQLFSGLDHIRFFLSPQKSDGVYPYTERYLDNISIKTYRDGTEPVICASAKLESSLATIDNTKTTIASNGFTVSEFKNSLSASDSYTYEYSFVDESGLALSDSDKIKIGNYLRAKNTLNDQITYYRFVLSSDTKILSDTASVLENRICGYNNLTAGEIENVLKFPEGSTYIIKNADGSLAGDNTKIRSGMTLTITAADKNTTAVYTFGGARVDVSKIGSSLNGYALSSSFTTGEFAAKATVTNYTSSPIKAKMIVAQYSSSGRLKKYSVSPVKDISESEELSQTVSITSASAGDKLKVFVWDSVNAPLTECVTLFAANKTATDVILTYPSYTTKALTFSFDDGAYGSEKAGDKRLKMIFEKYGIKSTWNIISSRITDSFMTNSAPHYLAGGDELANHGYQHRRMSVENEAETINGTVFQPMTLDDCKYEIGHGAERLNELFGISPTGFIWPYGAPTKRSDYAQILEYISSLGVKYVRPTEVNGSFEFPQDWYNWKQSARITNANQQMLTNYLALSPLDKTGLKQFSIWGHAYEVTYAQQAQEGDTSMSKYINDLSYDDLDKMCKQIDDEGESWYCTNAELYNYYTASQSIRNENNILYNDTDIDLYAVIDGQKIKIPAHGMAAKK